MDSSRFLIIGANGQLGKALQAKYPDAVAVDRDQFDMTSWDAVASYTWEHVDVILNAAAYTNVDGAETPEGRATAWTINAVGPSYLSKVATEHGITLVHVSSDYVFDGTQPDHREDEPFTPLGVYAQTKAAGDIAISITPSHYIFRVSWLIGDGPNFVRTMMNVANKGISPDVVADQVGRLTFTHTLVDAIDHVLTQQIGYGTYHLSNDGQPASWADITRAIFIDMGRDDLEVTDTTTETYFASKPGIAPRPLQSVMDLGKIKASGLVLRDWRDDLQAYIQAEAAKDKE
jgi:dTDP-4-dehydrorhamnose 3,5-epimerase